MSDTGSREDILRHLKDARIKLQADHAKLMTDAGKYQQLIGECLARAGEKKGQVQFIEATLAKYDSAKKAAPAKPPIEKKRCFSRAEAQAEAARVARLERARKRRIIDDAKAADAKGT